MVLKSNNPVARLHGILVRLKESDKQDNQAKVALAEIMAYPANDKGFTRAIRDFMFLLKEVEKSVQTSLKVEDQAGSLAVIEDFTLMLLGANIWDIPAKSLISWIDSKYLLPYLNMLSNGIKDEYSKVMYTEDFLSQLSTQFNEIRENLMKSDLSSDFKGFVLKKLNDVLYVIDNYHIFGVDGLKNAIDSTIGEISTQNLKDGIKSKDWKNPCFRAFLGLCGTLALLNRINVGFVEPTLSTFTSYDQLTEKYLKPEIEEILEFSGKMEEALAESNNLYESLRTITLPGKETLELEGKQTRLLPQGNKEEE